MLAENIATQVVNNGSFNCNAAKYWSCRSRGRSGRNCSSRSRDIPGDADATGLLSGAQERFAKLTQGKTVTRLGRAGDGELPWTLIRDVSPKTTDEPLFSTEPFCSIIGEVALPEKTRRSL